MKITKYRIMKMKNYSSFLGKLTLGLVLSVSAFDAQAQKPITGYCTPNGGVPVFAQTCGHPTNWAYIRSFRTTGGITNITNTNTNCGNTSTSFSDYTGTNMLVKQEAFKSVNLLVTFVGNTAATPNIRNARVRVYVDWDNNGDFLGQDEFLAPTGTLNPHPHDAASGVEKSITLTVPGHAKEGLTRMRIITSSQIQQVIGGGDQCNAVFGEAEDYTFEVVNPCLPPNVLSIANLDYKSADFSWTPKLNAEFYEYLITPVDYIPNDGVIGFTFTTNTSVDVDTFKCNTTYYVNVRVICDSAGRIARDYKKSAWIRDSFKTDPCCYAPVLTVDSIKSTTARVRWEPVPTAIGYEYAVSVTETPPQQGTYTTNTAVILQGLTPKVTHFVHVRTRCTPTPLSDWSKKGFKNLGPTTVNQLSGREFSMDAYPNPMQDNMIVQLNGTMAANARLTVTDLTGKIVYNAAVNDIKVTINVANMSSGIYIVKYQDDTHNEIMRVTKR